MAPSSHGTFLIWQALLDDALRHSLDVSFRLGVADPPERNPFNAHPTNKSVINCKAHQQLAKDAADQSLVLLKNAGASPPLQCDPTPPV